MLFAWLRTLDDDAFDSRSHQLHIMAIRSLNGEADRDAVPEGSQAAFHPALDSVGRIGAGFFPAQRGRCRIAPSIESQSQ